MKNQREKDISNKLGKIIGLIYEIKQKHNRDIDIEYNTDLKRLNIIDYYDSPKRGYPHCKCLDNVKSNCDFGDVNKICTYIDLEKENTINVLDETVKELNRILNNNEGEYYGNE